MTEPPSLEAKSELPGTSFLTFVPKSRKEVEYPGLSLWGSEPPTFGRRQELREGQGGENHSCAQKWVNRGGWEVLREPASLRREGAEEGGAGAQLALVSVFFIPLDGALRSLNSGPVWCNLQ